MSAKDVVAKAKEEGLTLTENYVHTIRSAAKRKAGESTPRSASAAAAESRSSETLLMDLIIEHGLPSVQRMLANVAAKLRSRV